MHARQATRQWLAVANRCGGEFHARAVWIDLSLVFYAEEREDGRILKSTETWKLIEDGATFTRFREKAGGEKQIPIDARQEEP